MRGKILTVSILGNRRISINFPTYFRYSTGSVSLHLTPLFIEFLTPTAGLPNHLYYINLILLAIGWYSGGLLPLLQPTFFAAPLWKAPCLIVKPEQEKGKGVTSRGRHMGTHGVLLRVLTGCSTRQQIFQHGPHEIGSGQNCIR